MKILLLTAGISISLLACNSSQQKTTSEDSTAITDTTTGTATTAKDTAWVSLFDGQSFKGWHTYGKDSVGSAWQIDSGMIHLNPKAKKGYQTQGGGDIVTDDEYEDFDLKLEWKISKAGNSGIIFLTHEDTTKYRETWQTGPEMQVLDNQGHEDRKTPSHRAGSLYDLIQAKEGVVKPWGEWNQAEIRLDHGKLDLFLNGENVVSTTMFDDDWKKMIANSKFKEFPDFATYQKGHIALQDHGNEVWYRNIMIRQL